ncbi:MAG: CDP-alcohol phosphatidyltransferase family protein [Bacteroidales bacterium]|nr:CDP-alcohol phosphatidyltransferase family protein [Bacteroidales bacterium]
MFVDLKRQYRQSLKSYDTEEGIDLAFYRPIGFAWAYLFRRLGVTPNAVTIASIFLGVGAGIMFYYNNLWVNVIGMLLLIWANSFDSCDGQLARMTGQYSKLGRILDGLSGDLWFATIYIAICLRENVTSDFFSAHPWLIWTIAVITGICHAKQAAMADYYRQFHLYFVKGEGGSELEHASELEARLAELSWSRNFWRKLTMTFYTKYTVNQEAWTPAMQRLRAEIARRWPDGRLPADFRHDFRMASLPLMKYTNILSFNWRTIILFTSLFVRMPWIYFAFELIVLNVLLVYMMHRHESICRRFTILLEDGKY